MLNEQKTNAKLLSPLTLAFMGDAVYEVFIREKIILLSNAPVNKLHTDSVKYVKASAQAQALNLIYDKLTEQEVVMYKRGRNANGNNIPKNSNPSDYRKATGFETLIGYLHIDNQSSRINELLEFIWTNLYNK